ncbi:MAG: hypothetical protein AAFR58_25935 [Cyanobacteria bacterium J06627_28]
MSLTSSIPSITTATVTQSDAPSEKMTARETASLHKLSLLASSSLSKRSRRRRRQGFKPRRRGRPRHTVSGGSR